MTDNKTLTNLTVIPQHFVSSMQTLVPKEEIEKLSVWKKLTPSGRQSLAQEIIQVAGAKSMHNAGGLAMGKYLKALHARIKEVEPYTGSFKRICEGILGFDRVRTAYRYMEVYSNLEGRLSGPVVEAALLEGLDIRSASKTKPFGKYTEAFKLLPPPKVEDPATLRAYVRNIKKTHKMERKAKGLPPEGRDTGSEEEQKPETLLRNAFYKIRSAKKHIPKSKQKEWLSDLFGYAMHYWGYASASSFTPVAPPEDFRTPGRPPREHEAA